MTVECGVRSSESVRWRVRAASVFERAARRATTGSDIGRRGRRCLQGEIEIRFEPFPAARTMLR